MPLNIICILQNWYLRSNLFEESKTSPNFDDRSASKGGEGLGNCLQKQIRQPAEDKVAECKLGHILINAIIAISTILFIFTSIDKYCARIFLTVKKHIYCCAAQIFCIFMLNAIINISLYNIVYFYQYSVRKTKNILLRRKHLCET